MYKLTFDQFIEQVNKTKNFDNFKDAHDFGFMIILKNGYALQVDTTEYEWLEVIFSGDSVKYFGTM